MINMLHRVIMNIFGIIGMILFGFTNQNIKDDLSNEDKIFYGFINNEGSQIAKKYQMRFCGIGRGIDEEGVWLIKPCFQRRGSPLAVDSARELIINCLNDYLFAINNNEELKSYLKIYPFTPKNIDMTILNSDFNGEDIHHPYIRIILTSEGKIKYLTYDNAENNLRYKSKKNESYDEAIAILSRQKIKQS